METEAVSKRIVAQAIASRVVTLAQGEEMVRSPDTLVQIHMKSMYTPEN